jgi:hypothetical protein
MASTPGRWEKDNRIFVALECIFRSIAYSRKELKHAQQKPWTTLPISLQTFTNCVKGNDLLKNSTVKEFSESSILAGKGEPLPMRTHDVPLDQVRDPQENLSSCASLDGPTLQSQVAIIPTKERWSQWDLSLTEHILDSTLQMMAQSLSSYLRKIDLEHCSRITDTGLLALAHYAPQVYYLNLGDVALMTDVSVEAFAKAWSQTLRSVDLSRNQQISAGAVIRLINSCPHVSECDARGCSRVYEEMEEYDPAFQNNNEEKDVDVELKNLILQYCQSSRSKVLQVYPFHPEEEVDDDDGVMMWSDEELGHNAFFFGDHAGNEEDGDEDFSDQDSDLMDFAGLPVFTSSSHVQTPGEGFVAQNVVEDDEDITWEDMN